MSNSCKENEQNVKRNFVYVFGTIMSRDCSVGLRDFNIFFHELFTLKFDFSRFDF